MDTFNYRSMEVDIGEKDRYKLCLPIYKDERIHVVTLPLDGRFAFFEDGKKIRDGSRIRKIIDSELEHIDELAKNPLRFLPSYGFS